MSATTIAARLDELYATHQGEDLAHATAALMAPHATAMAFTGGDDAWSGRDAIRDGWLLPEAARHAGYRKRPGPIWTAGTDIAVFHVVSCEPEPGRTAQWLGLDVFETDGEQITKARFGNDTLARESLDRSVDVDPMWKDLRGLWSPTTTAANRVGMARVVEHKSSLLDTTTRYRRITDLLTPEADIWSWEFDGLLHLDGRDAVVDGFWEPLYPLMPDFYEAVDRAIVFGNALLMAQYPSGTFTNGAGKQTFSAWYNLDIYVFDEERISHLVFARDTLKDQRQLLSAFRDSTPPELADSIHLAPFK